MCETFFNSVPCNTRVKYSDSYIQYIYAFSVVKYCFKLKFQLAGDPIKQADTILMGYPLHYSTEPERRNDLIIYEKVSGSFAPS